MKIKLPVTISFLFLGIFVSFADQLTSFDNQIVVDFDRTESVELNYSVRYRDSIVIEPSVIGINVGGLQLGKGVKVGVPLQSEKNETYETRGNHRIAVNQYKAWTYPVTHLESGRIYSIEFRVYNDGVALRYIVPGEGMQHVDGENTSWKVIGGAKTWFFERLTRKWKLKSYAGEWISVDIEELHTATPEEVGPVQGTPLVFELPNKLGYAAITKAATCRYSGMRLNPTGDRTVVADFTEGDEGFDVEGTIASPWRVTMLSRNLNELVNSDLIKNLNPAPDPVLYEDRSYIKPGRSVWSWETRGLDTPETQREFIDLAAELGFEYTIIDDGWKDWENPWQTVQNLCEHAAKKNVGVWLWVHSNDISNPEYQYLDMKRYFDRIADVGAVGLKIDFMNGETKELIDFEIAALKIAAERKLLINFHGCHSSTGEERTYPNELTREGIRGIEVNKHADGPLPAWHNAALPFTRFIVGHADYTPILYTNPGPTSWAHQLATAVSFLSPMQVYAEHPHTMLHHPVLKQAVPLMKAIPTVWDETIVLPGSDIGQLSAFARRSGHDWFVAVLNGSGATTYELNFSFLGNGDYLAMEVEDDLEADTVSVVEVGPNEKAVGKLKEWTHAVPFSVNRRMFSRGQTTEIQLAAGGGYVVHLKKQSK